MSTEDLTKPLSTDSARRAAEEIVRLFSLEKPGWVTVGRITIDGETETEKFERTSETATDRIAAIIKHFAAAPADNEYGPSLVAFNLKTGVAYCPYCKIEFERQSDGSYLTFHDCKGAR